MSLTQRELQIHLHQGLLHALGAGPGGLDQRLAVAEIGAEGDNAVRGPETPAQEAHAVEFADPLAVGDIGFSSGHVL